MRNKIAGLLLSMLLIQFGVIYWVYSEQNMARDKLVKSQRESCERGKLDRRDNAAFQRAHTTYITRVTGARSVKEDVKQAAREAQQIYKITSQRLTDRSKINCKKVFP